MKIKLALALENAPHLANMLMIDHQRVAPVGSVLITGSGKDLDFLVLVDDMKGAIATLKAHGFKRDIDEEEQHGGSAFVSMRKTTSNVLLTDEPMYFASEVTIAHAACTAHYPWDLESREGRVGYHRQLRDAVRRYVRPVQEGRYAL